MPVDLEARGPVALVTIRNPEKLNALTPGMLDEIDGHLDTIEADDGLRAVVIVGDGQKAFVAGADIGHMREASVEVARDYAERGHAVLGRIEAFPKPVIAAVNGYALGGGCELALACDIRLAADTARIGLPEVTLGILPGWGGTQRLPRLTSPGFAKEMIFTGRHVKADEALAAGLVNRVLPLAELVDGAIALGEEIAKRPPLQVAWSKELVNGALAGDHAGEIDAFARAFATEDQREGMAAFFDKREARFTGR